MNITWAGAGQFVTGWIILSVLVTIAFANRHEWYERYELATIRLRNFLSRHIPAYRAYLVKRMLEDLLERGEAKRIFRERTGSPSVRLSRNDVILAAATDIEAYRKRIAEDFDAKAFALDVPKDAA